MLILAFESSAKAGSVALLQDGILLAEYFQNGGQTHSRTLNKMAEDMLTNCDGGTGFMHEGFHVDDPTVFTRPWFTWPDSLFCEFVNKCMDEGIV